jgi:phenylalanyl-tRNA synthetase beta chain
MKASIEWLKDYSDIDIDSVKLGDILTMTGSKVETIEQKGNDIKNVVVGKILEIKKHEDSDHLVVTQVDLGNEKVQIVTGADNIKVGDIVPIAKDGSELPGDIKIKKGMLRGVESCGMMCSVGELGLDINDYPGQIEHGIMILDKKLEKEIGKDIVEVLNLKEDIIDFEITPNRPDCLSIEGLGREVAVSTRKKI